MKIFEKMFEEKTSETVKIFVIIYWIICAAFIILILSFVLFLSVASRDINADPDDDCEAVTKDGVFTVTLSYGQGPFDETILYVSHENDSTFKVFLKDCNVSFSSENDSAERYAKIINEYGKDSIRAYEFRWGIIYTLNDGRSFSGIPNSQYSHIKTRDGECFTVYCSSGGKDYTVTRHTKIIIYGDYKEIVNIDFEYSRDNRDCYDYYNDFVKNYSWVKKYRKKDLNVYEFDWGMVYTYDCENYFAVLKHEYEEKVETDEEFYEIYNYIRNEKPG